MPYINVNQPQVHMCPSILNPLPTPFLWVVPEHQLWVPCSSILHMAIYMFNAILSNHPTLTFSHRVQKSVLYNCVSFAALYKGKF